MLSIGQSAMPRFGINLKLRGPLSLKEQYELAEEIYNRANGANDRIKPYLKLQNDDPENVHILSKPEAPLAYALMEMIQERVIRLVAKVAGEDLAAIQAYGEKTPPEEIKAMCAGDPTFVTLKAALSDLLANALPVQTAPKKSINREGDNVGVK